MYKVSLGIASLFISGAALAGGYGAGIGAGIVGGGYAGSTGGYAESATVGGSQATTGNYGTGLAVQFSSNEGAGYAAAGGHISPDGVTTYTAGGSSSYANSGGFALGNGYGETAGGVGTDYSANAWGSFQSAGFGIGGAVASESDACNAREDTAVAYRLGYQDVAALRFFCFGEALNRRAYEAAGHTCPEEPRRTSAAYQGDDPIVRRRLGLE